MVLAAGSFVDYLEHELTFAGGGFSVKLFSQASVMLAPARPDEW
jgi:hypothetical protein